MFKKLSLWCLFKIFGNSNISLISVLGSIGHLFKKKFSLRSCFLISWVIFNWILDAWNIIWDSRNYLNFFFWVVHSYRIPVGEWEWESTASSLPGGKRCSPSSLGLSLLLLGKAEYSSSSWSSLSPQKEEDSLTQHDAVNKVVNSSLVAY